jgi:hypothetical protein
LCFHYYTSGSLRLFLILKIYFGQVWNQIFTYEYDFGDGWDHQLLIEDILKRDLEKQYPVCLEGENACPREDSGGPFGYAEMMEIIRNPAHPEYRSTKTWLGKGFDAHKFDLKSVNKRLSRMLL